jgi:hypothetical protein
MPLFKTLIPAVVLILSAQGLVAAEPAAKEVRRTVVAVEVSWRGHLDSDFAVFLGATGRSRAHIEATADGGGPELTLHTFRGSFRLRSSLRAPRDAAIPWKREVLP